MTFMALTVVQHLLLDPRRLRTVVLPNPLPIARIPVRDAAAQGRLLQRLGGAGSGT
jgi:hypothetical protein